MELKHYIDNIEIDEPIGFDNLKTSIKRGEYHGMSAEVSVGTLEFYGIGADILRYAYNESVENKPVYRVTLNGEELYSGVCDMASYSEHSGDYCSVSCNVGEIGVKTTFNSHLDAEINLNDNKDIAGNELASTYNFHGIEVPKRTIKYTNKLIQQSTDTYNGNENNGITYKDDTELCFLNISLFGNNTVEFGDCEPNLYCANVRYRALDENDPVFTSGYYLDGYVEPLLKKPIDFETKFGKDLPITIKANITLTLKFTEPFFTNMDGETQDVYFLPMLVSKDCGGGTVNDERGRFWVGEWKTLTMQAETLNDTQLTFNIDIDKTIDVNISTLYLGIRITHNNKYNNETPMDITITRGSYIEMTIDSKFSNDVTSKMMSVYDALDKTIDVISEQNLQLQSEYYSTPLNSRNATYRCGCAGTKLLSTGFYLRELYNKPFNTSFKQLIDSLSMQDCIGWCFEEIDGKTIVRIEPWKYFYKDVVLLEITSPYEITKTIDTDYAVTSFLIGYKKYEDNEDIKAMDSIHGELNYVSNITTLSKQLKKQCDFIADNYAIELTRRASITVDKDDEYKYDENIFVFSAIYGYSSFDVVKDGSEYENVSQDTYNVKISPAQCALRWIDFLFALNGEEKFVVSSGKLNYTAKALPERSPENSDGICDSSSVLKDDRSTFRENSDLKRAYSSPILRAETINVKYPITLQEYKRIKQNPYGLVVLDGNPHWIKEFQYSFVDGEAEFKLTPKR